MKTIQRRNLVVLPLLCLLSSLSAVARDEDSRPVLRRREALESSEQENNEARLLVSEIEFPHAINRGVHRNGGNGGPGKKGTKGNKGEKGERKGDGDDDDEEESEASNNGGPAHKGDGPANKGDAAQKGDKGDKGEKGQMNGDDDDDDDAAYDDDDTCVKGGKKKPKGKKKKDGSLKEVDVDSMDDVEAPAVGGPGTSWNGCNCPCLQ